MMSNTADKSVHLTDTQQVTRDAGRFLTRKIWIPKAIYNLLPYFYLFAGFAALLATVYINAWFWVLPHYLLFAGACLHLGVLVYRRRHRRRS